MANIGDRIRHLRTSANLTQSEFGRIFGVVKSTVSLYESGKSTPNDQIKMNICKHFGVTLDYLLGVSDDPTGTKKAPADERELQLSDIQFALLGEVRDLDLEDQEELLRDARRLKELKRLKKLNEERGND